MAHRLVQRTHDSRVALNDTVYSIQTAKDTQRTNTYQNELLSLDGTEDIKYKN
jgi:hypothetical protein